MFTSCEIAGSEIVEGSEKAKIKRLYNTFNMTLKQFGMLHGKISIDQTMVPHKGLHWIDQFMTDW